MKKILLTIIFLLCCLTIAQAQEHRVNYKYTILKKNLKSSDRTLPNIHPPMEGGKNNYVMISVQEGDLLRVAFYEPNLATSARQRFDVHNPTRRDFVGQPARYRSPDNPGILFADGTEFDAYLPPDAQPIGSEEWRYQMRWQRVYKNYYYITVYRGAGVVCLDALVTAEEGCDISIPLGESSINADNKRYFALGVNKISVYYYANGRNIFDEKQQLIWIPEELKQVTLIPVEEKDLPPDFPKGLVRWIP